MKGKPKWDDRILEAIEACRSGSDDLSDPALAFLATELAASPELDEVFERGQKLDTILREVFREVPTPEDLEERILARLVAAQPAPGPAVTDGTGRTSRRWWVAAASLTAVAATVAVVVPVYFRGPASYANSNVIQEAIDFFNVNSTGGGRLLSDAAPQAYPFSDEVRRLPQIRWRRIRGFLDRPGVAYDIPVRPQAQATLYVVKGVSVKNAPGRPPLRPTHMTGGRAVATWQSDGLLYVLVVQGGARTYRSLLDQPAGPIT